MEGIKRFIRFGLAVFSLFLGFSAVQAENLFLFDFHGIIVETRADRVDESGGFPSRFRLYRNFIRSNTLQAAPTGPEYVDVTAAELEAMELLIAKGDGKPGTLSKKVKLVSGIEIIPGEYHLRTPDSYQFFHEGKDGTNHLLNAFLEAEKRDPSGKSWRGKYWDYFVQLLSHPETAAQVGILSASGHSKQEWKEFFQALLKRNIIKNIPNMDLIFSTARREFDQFSLEFNSAQQKAALLEEIAVQLARRPLTADDLRLDVDGRGYAKSHSLIVVEDRPEIVEVIAHMFRRLTTGRVVSVKFGIFNGGTETEVRDLGRPALTIINSSGLYRPATQAELWGEAKIFKSAQLKRICGRIFRNLARGGSK